MKKLFVLCIGLFAANVLSAHAAEAPANFSAEMSMRSPEGTMQGKVYAGEKKNRMEFAGNIVISRLDKNTALMLIPAQKMYMEQPLQAERMPKTAKEIPGEVSREALGTETVDGKEAKKFKVVYSEKGVSQTLFQWLADDLPVPLKLEAADGSWTVEYHNIQIGPQPDSLFEAPAGYQKLEMPGMPAQ